jgi:GT2 family glycosyltransferase
LIRKAPQTLEPRVSVVIVAHNEQARLQTTLNTLLDQTWRDFELLVIDDGSTDLTSLSLSSCDDRRMVVLTNPVRLGAARSLSRALSAAQGQFVALANPGDRCEHHRLERQVHTLDSRPDLSALGAWHTIIDESGRRLGHCHPAHEPIHLAWDLCWGCTLHRGTIMMRRRAVVDAGGFDPVQADGCDYELWTRLVMLGHRLAILPEYLTHAWCGQGVDTAGQVEHDAALRRAMARYHHWLHRPDDGRPDPWPVRRLLHDRALLPPGRALGQRLAAVQAAGDAWRRRLPAHARVHIRQHVSDLLLQISADHLLRQPRSAGQLLAHALRCRPAAALDADTWRQAGAIAVQVLRQACPPAPPRAPHSRRPQRFSWQRWRHRRAMANRVAQHRQRLTANTDPITRPAIIAVHLPHELADLLAAEPVLRQLRLEHPRARLVAAVAHPWADLVHDHPEPDDVITLRCTGEFAALNRTGVLDRAVDLSDVTRGCERCAATFSEQPPIPLANRCSAAQVPLLDRPRLFIHRRWIAAADRLSLPRRFVLAQVAGAGAADTWDAVQEHLGPRGLALVRWHDGPAADAPVATGPLHLARLSPALLAQVMHRAELVLALDEGLLSLAQLAGSGTVSLGDLPARHLADRVVDAIEQRLVLPDRPQPGRPARLR